MPFMKPPKDAVDPVYGLVRIIGDRPVNVSLSDVEAMLSEGWEIVRALELNLEPIDEDEDTEV